MRKPLHPISTLIIKHLEGTISPMEREELDKWIYESSENTNLFNELCDEYRMNTDLTAYNEDKKATWIRIITMSPELEKAPVKLIKRVRYAGVAIVLVLTVIGAWSFALNLDSQQESCVSINKSSYKNDVEAPGINKATLTLADGKRINLDDVNNGQLAEQGAMQVVKQEDGEIEYRKAAALRGGRSLVYNTISTAKGGRYKVVLADNSVVWLNSASSLKYPTSFTDDDRVVELTGEGYFEVAKNRQQPFIVKVNGMQIEVLGTHFNIMSYPDESSIKATLLEGSVSVTPVPVSGGAPVARQSRLLSPGQQAILSERSVVTDDKSPVKVIEADMEEAMAWKNEVFIFNHAPIETIMRQLARWYDIEIAYEGAKPIDKFNVMGISRNVPISQVLKVLELTSKVKFEIEGRKITVRKV